MRSEDLITFLYAEHVRIYTDGQVEVLPALEEIFLTSDPVEAKRLEEKHDEYASSVTEMLAVKGFDKFTINISPCWTL
ncbi:MAG: hypothetical protein B655_2267 [Methanobacterium sp. Maddingley MBC34]|nr:MAG: hypothetical protein B655_2267 [Methanobacterium sp. Maddingley MBC34]